MTDAERLLDILDKLATNIEQRNLDESDRLPLLAAIVGLRMVVTEGADDASKDVISFLKTIMGSIATSKKLETDRLRAEKALYTTMRQTARNMIQDLQKSKLDIYVDPTSSTPTDVMAALENYSRDRHELTR